MKKIICAVFLGLIFSLPVQAENLCLSKAVTYSAITNTITIRNVLCRLKELYLLSALKSVALVNPSPGIYFLKSNIKLIAGATLKIHGPDVLQLRLLSNNNPAKHIEISADWGFIDIKGTKITSWDQFRAGPDTDITNGRAYIRARSYRQNELAFESKMNVRDSEIAYLGFNGTEAYGLTWKVRGVPDATYSLFDKVNVYGKVSNNHLHHNYMGIFTFGASAMSIFNNEVDNNISYGIDPHDDSDYLVIDHNLVHHNGKHGIICSKRCDHLRISNNESYANKDHGIMLHSQVNYSAVTLNNVHDNLQSGIVLQESHNNTISNNIVRNNMEGIRLYTGSSDNVLLANEITNNSDGIAIFKGTDIPLKSDGRCKNNTVEANTISNNKRYGLRLLESDRNTIERNQFVKNIQHLYFRYGVANVFQENTFSP